MNVNFLCNIKGHIWAKRTYLDTGRLPCCNRCRIKVCNFANCLDKATRQDEEKDWYCHKHIV